jgi:hypothetical protein
VLNPEFRICYAFHRLVLSGRPAAQLCADRVRGCDVYVLGTRYGSPVPDKPEVSYTELEFKAAAAAGLPAPADVLVDADIPVDAVSVDERARPRITRAHSRAARRAPAHGQAGSRRGRPQPDQAKRRSRSGVRTYRADSPGTETLKLVSVLRRSRYLPIDKGLTNGHRLVRAREWTIEGLGLKQRARRATIRGMYRSRCWIYPFAVAPTFTTVIAVRG